jgi:hypothetical protein
MENQKDSSKKLAIKTIKNKIGHFISSGIYSDLSEFISDNPNLAVFQDKTKLNNSLKKFWGYQITEEDYQLLLTELKAELEERLRIENEKITTTSVNGKEIVTYDDGDRKIIVDNSYASISLEEQLPGLQEKYARFRQGESTNTVEMMEFMQDEIKPAPTLNAVNDIDVTSLSSQEVEMAAAAKAYQDTTDNVVQVDLIQGIVEENGKIQSIEKRDDGYGVFSSDQQEDTKENTVAIKAPQKTLQRTPYKQAGFSDTLILALLTGMILGLLFINIYLKIS